MAALKDGGEAGDAAERDAWESATGDVLTAGLDGAAAAFARARAHRRAANDAAAEEALRSAIALASPGPMSVAAHAALAWHLHLTTHPDEADASFERAIAEAEGAKLSFVLARSHHLRGVVRFHRGRVDEAAVDFRAALELDRRAGRVTASTLSGLGDVLGERGDVLGARRAYEDAERLARAEGNDAFAMTVAVRRAGALAFEDANAAWTVAQGALGPMPERSYWGPLVPAIAGFVALARGDRATAADLAARASAALGPGLPDLVPAEIRLLGALSAPPGSDDAASRAAVESLGLWRRIGNPVWLARAEACLATRDRSPRGRAAFERARRRLARLGVSRLAFGPGGGPLLALQPNDRLEVRCLGAFAVARDGVPIPSARWQSRKARDLLKLLVAARGRPVPREIVMERLWPEEEPERQANRLSVALATVRSVLDPEHANPPTQFVTSDGNRYGLDLGNLPVDVERFLAQVTAARSESDPDDRRDALEAAESAYSGDAFEDEPYADWAVGIREEARAAYAETVRTLAKLAIERGDTDAAVRYGLRLLERDPYDEEAHLLIVRTLLAAQRHGEARRAHEIYARRMRDLDVEPMLFPA
jgi:LuxR family maltose regulon positive regulatory protein